MNTKSPKTLKNYPQNQDYDDNKHTFLTVTNNYWLENMTFTVTQHIKRKKFVTCCYCQQKADCNYEEVVEKTGIC